MVETLLSDNAEDAPKHLLEVKQLFKEVLQLYDWIIDEDWPDLDTHARSLERRLNSKCKDLAPLVAGSRERPRLGVEVE
jgi:hypothetical protein